MATIPTPPADAALAALVTGAPRALPQTLDLLAPGDDDAVRIRLMTADPLEGRRPGPDRFVATHDRGEDLPPEYVAYLSYGQAERDAEAQGWDVHLARVVQTVRAAATDGQPVGEAHGDDPLADLQALAAAPEEPIDFTVGDWEPYSIGVMVDLAEAQDGPLGFPSEPMTPTPLASPTPGCAACGGQQLRPPHTPVSTIMTLCHEHQREHDSWLIQRLPQDGEDAAAMHELLQALGDPRVSGVGAGRAAVAREEERAADFLHRARGWFEEPGGLSAIYFGEDRYEEDSLAGLLHLATEQVNLEEGTVAALEALDDLRFLVPQACWLADVDAISWLGPDDARSTDLLDHLQTDHEDVPAALCAAAEQHELRGDTATAVVLFRRGYVRALAAGEPTIAELAETGLQRLGEEAPHPEQKVGRNDPCPCGSGRKFKKCCGR